MLKFATSRQRIRAIHFAAAAASAVLFGGAYASAQTQLLLNPSFEPGVDGSPNAAAGDAFMGPSAGPWYSWDNWAYNPVTNPNAEALYTQSVPAHTGVQLGKTYGGANGGIYQYVNINPYDAYTASAWFYNASSDDLEAGETDDVRLANFFTGPNGTGSNNGGPVASPTVTMSTPQNTWTQVQVQAAAPAGTQSVQWMAFFNNPAYNGGSLLVDDGSLLDTSWNGGGTSNNWSDNNNWGGVAPGQYAPVVFAGTTKLNSNNDTPSGTPYYGIAFTPTAGSFTLTGNQANLASDVDNYSTNSQTIALNLGLQQPTNFNTAPGNITVSGAIGGAFAINKIGSGMLTLSGANTYSGGTNVSAGTLEIAAANALPPNAPVTITGGTVQLAAGSGAQTISALSISPNATLDVNNNHLIINYAGGSDPIASITALLNTGFNGGHWNGIGGIDSTAAGANAGYALGYADSADPGNPANLSAGTLEIKYTLLGDANLDGVVNGIDFGILAANFNKGVAGWDKGDFNYDNVVNGIDFGQLAANFNKGATGASIGLPAYDDPAILAFAAANGLLADVPEPASAALLLLGAAPLLSRRMRRQRGAST